MKNTDTRALKKLSPAHRLQAADILLVHTKRSLWGWLIRFGTRCYWNHAMMVCSTGDTEKDDGETLVVDAKTNGNVVIRRMSEYLRRSDKYVVAVKRLDTAWFQNDSHVSQSEFRRHICNIALNEVDFKIASRMRGFISQVIRQLTVIYRFARRKIRRFYTPPNLPWSIHPVEVKAFTCGGFIQWCYYKAVAGMLEEKGDGQSRLREVIFNPRARKALTPFELLTTTPADLANSDKLSWKFIAKDGILQEASTVEDTASIGLPA